MLTHVGLDALSTAPSVNAAFLRMLPLKDASAVLWLNLILLVGLAPVLKPFFWGIIAIKSAAVMHAGCIITTLLGAWLGFLSISPEADHAVLGTDWPAPLLQA